MSEYREEIKKLRSDANWTFWKLLPLFLIVMIVIGIIGFAMNSFGLLGKTFIERKVFESSYQRSEGIKAQLATDTVALQEIEAKLQNPNLDNDTRFNLEAQAQAARMRIKITKERQ